MEKSALQNLLQARGKKYFKKVNSRSMDKIEDDQKVRVNKIRQKFINPFVIKP